MNYIILKTIMILGLNKAFIKMSMIFGFISTIIFNKLDIAIPKVILGITLFLWILYAVTVFLDWKTGIKASRIEAKKENKDWKFDREMASTSWYKHALFLIIMATIYHFHQETIRNGMRPFISNILIGAQYTYFAYNMLTEWYSIELNKKRINGKPTRLLKIIEYILDSMDNGFKKKVDNLTGNK